MLIDCDTCTAQKAACEGCVMTFLLATPSGAPEWDDDERRALEVLAAGGLIRMPRGFEAA
ncbi:hypothetical protein Ga0074812_1359 [Parafrankia irregularis]|uniref:Uncharacterized protein n=1 Tax=Parafrankia irregularis TaxID=795642 RepID=A0A0S4QX55_9ACTN|nr:MULTISPECIES: hypothetical protein [Parafrankia]MBE3206368.1 hypothetical protein [Parafrankia sp. CH37]CUU60067.1 hypothetical protein Ga0074812_1359 [Parafrankia irregularis]